MIYKIIHTFLRNLLIDKGINPIAASHRSHEILFEIFKNHSVPFTKRLWALRHGFFSDKFALYGLNQHNYQNYLSDLRYAWLSPQNGPYHHWISNKLVLRYTLYPFKKYLPEYYYQISVHGILPQCDCSPIFPATAEGLLALLRDKGDLACKPVAGSKGAGFFHLKYANDIYSVNEKKASEQELSDLVSKWAKLEPGYLIQEYLFAHPELAKIYPKTPNSIRLTLIKPDNDQAVFPCALARFGSDESGAVDNSLAGGIFSDIEVTTGKYNDGKRIINNKVIECKVHPDTGQRVEGVVPFWGEIKDCLLAISNYMPQMRFMAFDIVVEDDGFKIIEINPTGGIALIQYYRPIFNDKFMGKYFRDLINQRKSGFYSE